jgi:uncharacterized membrane protein
MITGAVSVPVIALNLLASSVWVGGLVAIFVVSRAARASLQPAQRIDFFRALGRRYGIVGSVALATAIATGAVLLDDHPWDGLLIATALVAWNLLAATAIGMVQARRMTRLRRRSLSEPAQLEERVRRGAIAANFLRATIGVLTLALVVLAAALAQ